MNLLFNTKEILAIVHIAYIVIAMDMDFNTEHKFTLEKRLKQLGINTWRLDSIIADALDMKSFEAYAIIRSLESTKKKYVAALLKSLMAPDKNVENEDYRKKHIFITCSLPTMDITQALQILGE